MFERFSDGSLVVLKESYRTAVEFNSETVTPAHLLAGLTRDSGGIAGECLSFMQVDFSKVKSELQRHLLAGDSLEIAPGKPPRKDVDPQEMPFDTNARHTLRRATELRRVFGHDKVGPEHLLLALVEATDEDTEKILEELGANVTHLSRIVLCRIAARDALNKETPSLQSAVIKALNDRIATVAGSVEDIERMTAVSRLNMQLPRRADVAHLVFISYLPDYLFTQLGYQRYLLEETLKLLRRRAGMLDPETAAAVVSTTGQNIRSEVRASIDYVWSHEFRTLAKLPDEVDYDLIGSVIEDIWWTHSEEIALNDVFDEAIDDHRRKQMLNLQKRRLEIAQRFLKLRARLEDTIRQCFLNRSAL